MQLIEQCCTSVLHESPEMQHLAAAEGGSATKLAHKGGALWASDDLKVQHKLHSRSSTREGGKEEAPMTERLPMAVVS